MADLSRFAGFSSPARLLRDPFLTHEDKKSGLATWRGMLERFPDGPEEWDHRDLVYEINRALDLLDRRR